MKSATMTMMIAAAALAVVAGSASAQTYKAEIPLAFKAANTVMAPGAYEVSVNTSGSGQLIWIRNRDTHQTVATLPLAGGDVPKAWRAAGKPVLSFSCVEGSCSLARMWNGHDLTDIRFAAPKNARGENVAELLVTLEKAE